MLTGFVKSEILSWSESLDAASVYVSLSSLLEYRTLLLARIHSGDLLYCRFSGDIWTDNRLVTYLSQIDVYVG